MDKHIIASAASYSFMTGYPVRTGTKYFYSEKEISSYIDSLLIWGVKTHLRRRMPTVAKNATVPTISKMETV